MKRLSSKVLLVLLAIAVLTMIFSSIMFMLFNTTNANQEQEQASATNPQNPLDNAETTEKIGDVQVTNRTIDNIPVTEYNNGADEKQPVAVLIHGFTSEKSFFEPLALLIAAQGITVITPDAYGHGERTNDPPISVLEMAVATSNELDLIFDYYEDVEYVDLSKMMFVGFSMGGFISYHYTANGEHNPTAVYTLCATPDWSDMLGVPIIYSSYEDQKSQQSDKDTEFIDDFILEASPLQALIEKTGVKYSMVFGDEDDLVTYEGGEAFYNIKSESEPGMVEYNLIEGMGHEITDEQVYAIHDYIIAAF